MFKASSEQTELPHKAQEHCLLHWKGPIFPPSEYQGRSQVPPGISRLDPRSCKRKNGINGNYPLPSNASKFQQKFDKPNSFSDHTMLLPPQHRNKINRAGELIVNSEESRYQMRNLAICLEKIRVMVTEATEKPKVVSKETAQQLIARYHCWDCLYLHSSLGRENKRKTIYCHSRSNSINTRVGSSG